MDTETKNRLLNECLVEDLSRLGQDCAHRVMERLDSEFVGIMPIGLFGQLLAQEFLIYARNN